MCVYSMCARLTSRQPSAITPPLYVYKANAPTYPHDDDVPHRHHSCVRVHVCARYCPGLLLCCILVHICVLRAMTAPV